MIFNIDFNKSGTRSLAAAMRILGYRALHFWIDGERIVDIVVRNEAQHRPLLTGIEDHDFFSDFNGSAYLPALYEQYPGSKFILTVRDMDSWLDSRAYHVQRNLTDSQYSHNYLSLAPDKWRQDRATRHQLIDNFFRDRRGELLVIDICGGQGWETLCPFLGKPIPQVAFPYLNKREDMDKKIK